MSCTDGKSPWRSRRLDEYYAEHRPGRTDDRSSSQPLRANDDKQYFVLWRGTHFTVRLSQRPYNNGHLLIVPYREVSGYRDLEVPEREALAGLIERTAGWLREAMQAEGYNVGMNEGNFSESGEPMRLHVHVVPRWNGDTNFMAAINETKVVPESLEDSYRRLRQVIPSGDVDV